MAASRKPFGVTCFFDFVGGARFGIVLLLLVACTSSTEAFERKRAVLHGTLRRQKTNDGVAWRYFIVDSRNERRYEVSHSATVELANFVGKPVRIEGRHRFSPLNGEHRLFPSKIRVQKEVSASEAAEASARSKPLLQVIDEGSLPSFIRVSHQQAEELPGPAGQPMGETGGQPMGVVEGAETIVNQTDLFVPEAGVGCPTCGPQGCGVPHRVWVRAEYLMWWLKGANVPPLVTTSPAGTAREDAGVLGRTGTQVLFGDGTMFDDDRHGGRIVFGLWLDPCNQLGVEGEVLGLSEVSESFTATSDGSPILARPFLEATTGEQAVNLVGFPALIAGSVNIDATSDFSSAGARLRKNLFYSAHGACQDCAEQYNGLRVDMVGGYRYVNLDESLRIAESSQSLVPAMPVSFSILDTFDTRNEFHGGEIGMSMELRRQLWWLELSSKIAFGNNRQSVRINGSTNITTAGIATPFSGGMLAQRTNSGDFSRDEFIIIPEIGVTLGVQLTSQLSLTSGYNFLYLSSVVRPGDQIDPIINPNLFPPEASPFSGPLRPEFSWQDSDLWVQGLSFGLHYIW